MDATTKAETRLREAGIRVTAPRIAIYKYLLETDTHPTCEQIYAAIKNDNKSLSLASVYNVTEKLSEESLLAPVIAPDGSRHYDGITELHGHFFCVDCGKIFDVNCPQEGAKGILPGSVISSIAFTATGYCPACVKFELKERRKGRKSN